MKKILSLLTVVAFFAVVSTSCIKEIDPQSSVITQAQAAAAPGSFSNYVSTITSSLCGVAGYSSTGYPQDYGYPTFYLMRDEMGQDLVDLRGGGWYGYWYQWFNYLGPTYAYCQFPWTYYYSWIKNCNTVISMAADYMDDEEFRQGAGIAYAIRAMMYMDLARMFAQSTYGLDTEAETVPIVDESTLVSETVTNARATNEVMWDFILSDLDLAEEYLADYVRDDVYTPDVTVVYGLKARAYLTMEDWANAQTYAKKAQSGYTPLTESEFLSWDDGFNTPTDAWIFGVTFSSTDECILENDADSSWGSWMILEVGPSECGYAANYGYPFGIDRHLYETIPDTDYRKKTFIDFSVDELGDDDALALLSEYSEQPDYLVVTSEAAGLGPGGFELKFRPSGGEHSNQYIGFCVAVPVMRVEEMMLIEAEAAGRQNLSEGLSLLNTFGQLRDPSYNAASYVHNEAYGNSSTSAFVNEVWWQRRVELWGEGFATFDIKRLNKGVIRSYENSNHYTGCRWNYGDYDTNEGIYPNWMDLCIVQTETNYNSACTNNPTAVPPTEDSAEVSSFD